MWNIKDTDYSRINEAGKDCVYRLSFRINSFLKVFFKQQLPQALIPFQLGQDGMTLETKMTIVYLFECHPVASKAVWLLTFSPDCFYTLLIRQ